MRTKFFIATLLLISLAFASCNKENIENIQLSGEEKSAFVDSTQICTDSIFATTIDDLTESDIAGLLLMREEEKLAHDIYVYFFEKFELSIFNRISFSETKHSKAILRLLNHFGLEDPTIDEAGVFSNSDLQELYNNLIATGAESVEAALQVGAFVEETDIRDLLRLINGTENADLIKVYANLLRGSYMHLKAFTRLLSTNEINYVPQILTQEEYDEIIAMANGNNGQGKGNSNGQGGKMRNGQKGGNRVQQDLDGDGLCDNTGEPVGEANGNGNKGQGNKGGNGNGRN